MARAELKTKRNEASVAAFLVGVTPVEKREDCLQLVEMMTQATGAEPKMWGASIVGFGSFHYKYASGREGDWFLTGFSPRQGNLTLYVMNGCANYGNLLERLGHPKTGVSCLYLKGLAGLDASALQKLIKKSVAATRKLDGQTCTPQASESKSKPKQKPTTKAATKRVAATRKKQRRANKSM